jgi:hypothetical protein
MRILPAQELYEFIGQKISASGKLVGAYKYTDGTTRVEIETDSIITAKDNTTYLQAKRTKPETIPYPTEDEFWEWVDDRHDGNPFVQEVYDYFKQFQYEKTVEVFPEVGKEYEFKYQGDLWYKGKLDKFISQGLHWTHIRPIQPSRLEQLKARLEQLKARKSELSKYELLELIELMEITK